MNLLLLTFLLHPLWWFLGCDQLVMMFVPGLICFYLLLSKQITIKVVSLRFALCGILVVTLGSGLVTLFEASPIFYGSLFIYKTICLFNGFATFLIVSNMIKTPDDLNKTLLSIIFTLFFSALAVGIGLPLYVKGFTGFDTPIGMILPEKLKSFGTTAPWLHKWLIREAPLFQTTVLRSKGLFLYSNLFSFSIETVIPLTLLVIFSKKRKWLYWVVLLSLVACFFMAQSRAGTLCLVAGLIVIWFLWSKRKALIAFLLTMIFVILFIAEYTGYDLWFTPQSIGRHGWEAITGMRSDATEGRYLIYNETLKYVAEKPFTGWGTLRRYPGKPEWPYLGSHSFYLSVLMRMGVLGVLTYLLFFSLLFKNALNIAAIEKSFGIFKMRTISVCLAGVLTIHYLHFIVLNIQADLMSMNLMFAVWGIIPAVLKTNYEVSKNVN